jgi:PAS domain S-box-containing protein
VPIAFPLLIALQLAAHAVSPVPAETAEQPPAAAATPARTGQEVGRQPRRVIALYWFGADHPVTITFDRQFQAVLKQQGAGETLQYTEYLETGRFPGESQLRIMRDYLRQKYADRKIDVLFCWGAAPLEFFLRYHDELFPGIPIVYYVSSLEAVKDLPAPPLTGVLNPDIFEKTLELALSLHPDTTDVFFVSGTVDQNKSIEREASQQFARFQNRVKLTYLTDLPLDQLLTTVRGLPRRSIILYSRQAHEDPARVLQPYDFLDPVSRAAQVPVYSPWRSYVGSGTVGGVVDDPVAGATKAAEIVLRVARGARPEDIPPDRVPKIPTFDARQLSRWGISEASLPADSVVLFREPTLWTRYRPYIIGTGVVLTIQTMLIAGLLVQRAQRRRVEAALRESEERFRLMADTAPVMIWRSNATKDCDFFNQPWLVFRGRSLREEAGSGWAQGVHPADRDTCLATYSSAFDERRSFDMEYRLQRADREYRWVMATGIPRFAPDGAFAGYIGSCFDITERRHAEAALRESEKRYALATAAGAVGVWDWNLETREIYVDPTLRRALGFVDHDIDNRLDPWDTALHLEDAARLRADVQACAEGRTPSFESEHRMVHRDGSIRWFLTRGSAVRGAEGRVTRLTGTDTDITERKRAEANLEETRHELARVARVTSLAQCAASIAHELSQPLASIQLNSKACLRWLGGSGVSTDELHGALLDIAEAATLANGVITRDREQFRNHTVEKEVLNLNDIVHEVASLVRTRLQQSHVTLEVKLANNLPHVRGDRVELQQVLLNMILNGIEAMESVDPRSRRITVETRLTSERHDVAQAEHEHHVQTTVRDTGTGIPEADVDRLFTPFYTTKPRGTGIGLSISRFIVETHGGRIWAEPRDGLGATFCFTVPAAAAEATGEDRGPAAMHGSEGDEAVPGILAS